MRPPEAVLAAALFGAFVPAAAGPAQAQETARTLALHCAGRLAEGEQPAAAPADVSFEAEATFGDGGILVLIDPQTKEVERVLYDAEATTGALRFGDGDAAAIVWTRLSGLAGPLVGQAIASDGDVLALSIESPRGAAGERPFALFRAAAGRLYRGACAPSQAK